MLDVAPTELLLVAAVAVIVIGPKDLPRAMRFAGHWLGKARGVARQFRQGFDDMVRESEFADMQKKWAEDNERIMREFPTGAPPAPALPAPDAGDDAAPVMTAEPLLTDPSSVEPAPKPARKPRAPRKTPAPKAKAASRTRAAS